MPAVMLWQWDDTLHVWVKAPAVVRNIRKTAVGPVVAGAHKLYWVACSPSAPGAEWQLTDDIAGGGAIVYDHFDPDKHSDHLIISPPMQFITGIWVEKFDHMFSLVFGYV